MNQYDASWTKKAQAIDIHYQRAYQLLGKEYAFAKWFSDDGILNITPMAEKFLQEKELRPQDKYRLYFTWKHKTRDQVREEIRALNGAEWVEFMDEQDILKIRIHN